MCGCPGGRGTEDRYIRSSYHGNRDHRYHHEKRNTKEEEEEGEEEEEEGEGEEEEEELIT